MTHRARHRDVVRRDRGRGRGRRARRPLVGRVEPGRPPPRFGGVVPEVASRAHVELVNAVIADALVEAGIELRRPRRGRRVPRTGLAGALLVGVSAAKAIALAADLPYVGVNHLEAHLHAALARGPRPRAAARGAHRLGRAHAARRDGGPRPLPGRSARRSTTRPARRSTRSPASSGSATRAARRSTGSPPRATRRASASPGPMPARRSTSPSRGSRPRWSNHHAQVAGARPSPTSPRRSRRRSSTCSWRSCWPRPTTAGARARDRRRGRRQLRLRAGSLEAAARHRARGVPAAARTCAPTTPR